MSRRYTLAAVTTDGQNNRIGIRVHSAINKWTHDLRTGRLVPTFKFYWTEHPDVTKHYSLFGEFCPRHRQDGIRIAVNLHLDSYYNPEYTLSEFCRMLSSGSRPALGWCATVKVC